VETSAPTDHSGTVDEAALQWTKDEASVWSLADVVANTTGAAAAAGASPLVQVQPRHTPKHSALARPLSDTSLSL
jgi:hypothetical protein